VGRPRTRPITVPGPPPVAKPCTTPGCRGIARGGYRFCVWCASRIKKGMASSGYLTVDDSGPPPRGAEAREQINATRRELRGY
jgi:hypothetical protein